MAPTTILGQNTETTPGGRQQKRDGSPLKISEMLAVLEPVRYIERTSVHSPAAVLKAKKAIRKAFLNQIENKGFSLVEILSGCPVCWDMSSCDAIKWIQEQMVKTYPLGVLVDR